MSKSMTDQVSVPPQPPPRPARPHRVRRRSSAAKIPATALVGQISPAAGSRPSAPRNANPIVPPRTVARRALLTLVAIMAFLSCLSVASVAVVVDRAHGWQRQIADEVTIQVKPSDGVDMGATVARAAEIAMQVRGVTATTILDEQQSTDLLKPWLGSNFDISELPIPRLIAVRVAEDADLPTLS